MATNANATYSLSDETGLGAEICKIALERSKNNIDEARRCLQRWGNQPTNKSKIHGLVCTYLERAFDAAAVIEVQCTDQVFANSKEFYELVGEIATETVQYEHHYCVDPKLPAIEKKHDCQIIVKSDRIVKTNALCLLTTYTHRDHIGVVVETEVDNADAQNNKLFKEFSFDLALHIAAFNPLSIGSKDIPAELRAELTKNIERELMRSNKPLNLWTSIITGKIDKWAEQRSLMNQVFIKNEKDSVLDIKTRVAEKIGSKITINRFTRFELGKN